MKKLSRFICSVLTVSMIVCMLSVSGSAVSVNKEVSDADYNFGDVNGDGKINLADSAYLFFSKLGIVSLNEKQKLASDVDGDGDVDFDDVRTLAGYSLSFTPCLPVQEKLWPEGETIDATDEYGNPRTLLFKDVKAMYYNQLSSYELGLNGTAILSKYKAAVDFSFGIKKMGVYLNLKARSIGEYKDIVGLARFNTIMMENHLYFVFPSLNVYSDLFDIADPETAEFIKEFNFADYFEAAISDLVYSTNDLYMSTSELIYAGTHYICEKYNLGDGVTLRCYFSSTGNLKRIEADGYLESNETVIIVINSQTTEVDDSGYDVPKLYIKVDYQDIEKYFKFIAG